MEKTMILWYNINGGIQMKEFYNFPIKFNNEEREKYKLWGLKEAKFLKISSIIIVIVAILIAIYKYSIIFGFYESDYWQYKLEVWGLTGQNSSFTQLFTVSFFIDIILIVICILLTKFMDLIFKLCYKPIVQKHIEIIIEPNSNQAILRLLEKDKLLNQEIVALELIKNNLDLKNNGIIVNNKPYIIGANNRKNIYLDMKPLPYLTEPTQYKNNITDLSHFNNIVDGLLKSFEEQKKEINWKNSNL